MKRSNTAMLAMIAASLGSTMTGRMAETGRLPQKKVYVPTMSADAQAERIAQAQAKRDRKAAKRMPTKQERQGFNDWRNV